MPTEYNPQLIDNMSAKFRRLNNPAHAMADAIGMLQMFPGVVGIWPGSVTDANGRLIDVSGNGLHMTANNAPTFAILTNLLAPAVRYVAASSQYHSLASAAGSVTDINGNETYINSAARGFTFVCALQFVTVPASVFYIAAKSAGGANAWLLVKDASNNIQFSIFNSTTQYSVVSSVTVSALQPYIITARFEPSTGLYLRVNNDEQSNTTSIPATIDSNATAFTIGARSTPSDYFDGTFSLGALAASFVPDRLDSVWYQFTAPLFGVSV